ncbi:ABC transporter [Halobacteriales archaeon QS_4_69_225]|nr:MAG: ABC transporter [Halobacteriales archaeon QS_4_69_225]
MSPHAPDGPVERTVQLTGGSTFTVSIPKGWAQERDIGPGTGLSIYPFEDRLVVAAGPDGDRAATLDADRLGADVLRRRVRAAYAAGADEITVRSPTGLGAEKRRAATSAVTELVGVQVAGETDAELTVRSLLDSTEVSPAETVDQLRGLVVPMHREAVEAVVADDAALAEHVAARDDDVDRLFALVCRQFYRVLGDVREADRLEAGRLEALTRFRVARYLERVADHAERVADVAARQPAAPSPAVGDRLKKLAAGARGVLTAALDGETTAALERRAEIRPELDALDRRLYDDGGEAAYLYGRAVESVRRTAENGGNVAEAYSLLRVGDD